MDENLLRLQNTVRALFLEAGGKAPAIPSVTPYRFTTTAVEMPHIDEPYLYLVLDGVLRLHTPSGIMDYMAGQYSLSKIDTPFSGTVLAFSGHQDLLAVSLTFTPSEVIETVLGLDDELMERILSGQLSEEETAASDSAVLEAVNRLFSAAEHTVPSAFLRKNIMQRSLTMFFAVLAESSLSKAFPTSGRRTRSIRPTAGSRKTFGSPSPWKTWRSSNA